MVRRSRFGRKLHGLLESVILAFLSEELMKIRKELNQNS
jgi:hypothetical protein